MPQLIYTNGGDVMMADLDGGVSRVLVPSQGRGYAVGVAYHWNSQTVFWSDTNTQKVPLIITILFMMHCLFQLFVYLCTYIKITQ